MKNSRWGITFFTAGAILCLGTAVSLGENGKECTGAFLGCMDTGGPDSCYPAGIDARCTNDAGETKDFTGFNNNPISVGHCEPNAFFSCDDAQEITVCTSVLKTGTVMDPCEFPVCFLDIKGYACPLP